MTRFRIFAIVIALTVALSSCNNKDVVSPYSGDCVLTVDFDWSDAPDADPEGMTLYFFPVGSDGLIWRFDIAGSKGGKVELPAGVYRMLAYNNDLPDLDFTSRDSYTDFSAVTRMRNNGMAIEPGLLYVGDIWQVDVSRHGVTCTADDGVVTKCDGMRICCRPQRRSVIYNIIVRNVSGMECLSSASVSLGGLAKVLRMVDDIPSADAVVEEVPLVCEKPESCELTATLTGLDIAAYVTLNQLTISGVCIDGQCFEHTVDVTLQMLNSFGLKNVMIVIDGLDIPKVVVPPQPAGSMGMEVDVDGWHEININLGTDSQGS